MDFVVNKARKLYEGIVTIIVLGIHTFLMYLSSRSITVIMQSEHLLFIKDSFLFFLIPIILTIVFVLLSTKVKQVKMIAKRIENDDALYSKIRLYLQIALFFVCLFWVLNTQMMARADQVEIQEAAFRVHFGDFGELQKDGYIGAHYNQIGLMLISYLFSFLFGSQNYVVFQIFNAVAISVIYTQLADFGGILGLKNNGKVLVQLSGFFFYPIIFFSSFVYGNIIGLALSLLAINYEYRFFKDKRTRYGFISAALIALAVMVKPNFSIYMIGILIYAAINIIIKKNYKSSIYIALVIIFFCIQSFGTKALFEKVSGIEIGDGISPYAFAAMGLQEGGLGPGWYDGYNDLTYENVKYDTREQRQVAIWNIKDRLKFFKENKEEAISFFTRKTAAQWNEPTYESLFILNGKSDYGVKVAGWVWYITTVHGGFVLSKAGKLFQIIVMFGALLYLLLVRKDEDFYQKLTPLMILIGGFVFHFVWEANGQYTIIFFILLIPYAVCGYKFLRLLFTDSKGVAAHNLPGIINVPSVALAVLFLLGFVLFFHGRSEFLTADTQDYHDYRRASRHEEVIPNGRYMMATDSGKQITAVPNPEREYSFDDDERMMYLNLSGEGSEIRIVNYHGMVRLYIPQKNLYLQHEGDNVTAADYKDTLNQFWLIKKSYKEGHYYILPCRKGIDTFDERMNAPADQYLGYDENGNLMMTGPESEGLWTFVRE